MSLTLLQLKTAALFAMGRTTATLPAGIDLVGLINRAGRALHTERAWDCRKVGPVSLVAVAAQEYITLPADYLEPITLRGVGGAENAQLVTAAEITRMREANPSTGWGGTWYVALDSFATAAGATSQPAPQALIYPTPDTNGQPTLSLYYLTRWRTLTADTDVANLTDQFDKALLYAVRAEAKREQNDEHPPELDWYAVEIDRLSRLEDRAGVAVMQVRGGAGEFRNRMGGQSGGDGGHFVFS